MSATFDKAREAILAVLDAHWRGAVNDVREEDAANLLAIADDATRYALRRQRGEDVAQDLAHLEGQVELLAAIAAVREGKRINETLLQVAKIAAEVAGELLKRLLV